MQKTITFHNGDKIILDHKGNTYIGELANEIMHINNKNKVTNQQFVVACNYGGDNLSKLVKSIN